MNTCRFSVIIPTRNRLEKLRRALRSVEQQTFTDYEVWIVDDGSTDGTREFLESGRLAQDYPGIPSIHIRINPDSRGAAAARNRAIAGSAGELVAFLDDDDTWLPAYLEQQSARLGDPGVEASCVKHLNSDADGNTFVPDLVPLLEYDHPLICLLSESFIHTLSVFACRKALFADIGPLNEQLQITHDWDWFARLIVSGKAIHGPVGAVLVRREVPGGLVAKYREWHREELEVLDSYLNDETGLAGQRRQVGAHRALLFARIGFSKGDPVFALKRLMEAFWCAPIHSAKIITKRLGRSIRSTIDQKQSRLEGTP